MNLKWEHFRKSLATLLCVGVQLADLCTSRPKIEIHREGVTFDGIASSASANEVMTYLESLNLFVLSSKDTNLTRLPANATLYKSENLKGISITYNANGLERPPCLTLPDDLQGEIKSISTFSSCVRLYSGSYCTGPNRMYTPYSYDHSNLGDFGKQVKSVGACTLFYFSHRFQ